MISAFILGGGSGFLLVSIFEKDDMVLKRHLQLIGILLWMTAALFDISSKLH